MFNAPLSLTTETAFELPAYLHESGADNPWVVANLHGRDVSSYLSGGAFDGFGNFWVADLPFGRIFRVTPTGEWDFIAKYDGWPAALAFHPDGRLIVADQRHGLLSMDIDSSKLSPFVTHAQTQRLQGIADLHIAPSGDIYFSDRGQSGLTESTGAVYRIAADGMLQRLAQQLPGPAGLALAADASALLVAMGGDNAIWRLPLVDGAVARAGRFVQMSGGAGPGGLTSDYDGNVFVAHAGLGCAWQFDKRGEARYRIDSCRGDWTTHLVRHPQHPSEYFITEAQTGTILKVVLPMY